MLEYRCLYAECPRYGQIELAATAEELFLRCSEKEYWFRWHEITFVDVHIIDDFTSKTSARFGAALRSASSDRVLRFYPNSTGMIAFPHWHFMDNSLEVEALILELWGLPRIFGTITDEAGVPVRSAEVRIHDLNGAVLASSTSGENGKYSLNTSADSELMITVDAAGFQQAYESHNFQQVYELHDLWHRKQMDFCLRRVESSNHPIP